MTPQIATLDIDSGEPIGYQSLQNDRTETHWILEGDKKNADSKDHLAQIV